MYYRNGSGIVGLLIGLAVISVIVSLLFSPVFWIVAAGLFLYSGYKRAKLRKQYQEYFRQYGYETQQDPAETRDDYSTVQEYSAEPSALFDGNYTEGTDDLSRIEEVYETNALDVEDFEVLQSPR